MTISEATAGATIYYTTNGSIPKTSSLAYSGPISLTGSETIQAIAIANGYSQSAVAAATYTINIPVVATPIFTPAAGTFTAAQTVTISDATAGAAIHFTTDGTTPTAASTLYSGPISVSATETIQAIATLTDDTNSPVASATYTIMPPAATPTFSLAPGTYTGAQSVTTSDSTPGSIIYYTTDGRPPTVGSTKYTAAIAISVTETLSAIAVASGYTASSVATAAYTIDTSTTVVVTTNANGNITGIPPSNGIGYANFAYNSANRLAAVTGTPLAATFIYDYAGKRYSKANNGTHPIVYSYSQDGTLLSENDNGTVTDYIYADGRPIAIIQPGANPVANQINYILADHLGTPQLVSNSSGITVWQTAYQPFGTTGKVVTLITQNLRFPGQYTDAETGFSYNLNRDYIPNIGQYLETDPIGLAGGMNPYMYAKASPLQISDPTGKNAAITILGPVLIAAKLILTPESEGDFLRDIATTSVGTILAPFGGNFVTSKGGSKLCSFALEKLVDYDASNSAGFLIDQILDAISFPSQPIDPGTIPLSDPNWIRLGDGVYYYDEARTSLINTKGV